MMLLPVAADWRNIGVLINMSDDVLEGIKKDEQTVNDRLRAMLSKWLKQIAPCPPTWDILADAVEKFNPQIAEKIKENRKLFFSVHS